MLTVTLNDRRNVDPLRGTYRHYFPDDWVPGPPTSVTDDYEENNWLDCWLAGQLWKRLCAPDS